MNKLTLESLQNWVDEVSPIKIDLATLESYIISKVEPGIAGRVRTLYQTKDEMIIVQTQTWASESVEILFAYRNFITSKRISETKWFLPNDRI